MVNHPAFFKFYAPELYSENLQIPRKFVRSLHGDLPENVILRDSYNNLWHVKLDKIGDNWFFGDGFTTFIHENMIESGYVLTFDYFGFGLFDFKIFGRSACEEGGFGGLINENIEEQYEMVGSHDDMVDDTDDNDHTPSTKEDKLDNCPRGGQVPDVGSSTCARRRRKPHDWFGTEIFRSGIIPQPVNWYFVTNKRRNRLSELYIPNEIVKHFNIELPETMILVDPKGRKFYSQRRIWKDGRVLLKGGWKSLCDVNLVKKDDHCICEFIKPKETRLSSGSSFLSPNYDKKSNRNLARLISN